MEGELQLEPTQGGLRAALYDQQVVLGERYTDRGQSLLALRIPREDLCRLLSAHQMAPEPTIAGMQAGYHQQVSNY